VDDQEDGLDADVAMAVDKVSSRSESNVHAAGMYDLDADMEEPAEPSPPSPPASHVPPSSPMRVDSTLPLPNAQKIASLRISGTESCAEANAPIATANSATTAAVLRTSKNRPQSEQTSSRTSAPPKSTGGTVDKTASGPKPVATTSTVVVRTAEETIREYKERERKNARKAARRSEEAARQTELRIQRERKAIEAFAQDPSLEIKYRFGVTERTLRYLTLASLGANEKSWDGVNSEEHIGRRADLIVAIRSVERPPRSGNTGQSAAATVSYVR
jgi:hypothetical protein